MKETRPIRKEIIRQTVLALTGNFYINQRGNLWQKCGNANHEVEGFCLKEGGIYKIPPKL